MKIIYKDLKELASVLVQCEMNTMNNNCNCCPFFCMCEGVSGEDIAARAVLRCAVRESDTTSEDAEG